MVQMKEIVQAHDELYNTLYIPHGSDERWGVPVEVTKSPSTFISHMVQMKDKLHQKVVPALYQSVFISHMVQMKDMIFADLPYFLQDFISHMVQMKGYCDFVSCLKFVLYIPHGSDERSSPLISMGYNELPLYPTWFRWKA